MTTKKQTPATAKAAAELPGDQQGTKLAQVADPAKLTTKQIDEIAKDDGSDDPENAANKDAAETLKQAKKDAKSDEPPASGYFHGQGGGAGDL